MKRKNLIVFILGLITLISFAFFFASCADPYQGKTNEEIPNYRIEKISENVIRIVALKQIKEIYYQLNENEDGSGRVMTSTYTFGMALAQGLAEVYKNYDVEKIVVSENMMQELILIVREKNNLR